MVGPELVLGRPKANPTSVIPLSRNCKPVWQGIG